VAGVRPPPELVLPPPELVLPPPELELTLGGQLDPELTSGGQLLLPPPEFAGSVEPQLLLS
jgi:hypothetical protein